MKLYLNILIVTVLLSFFQYKSTAEMSFSSAADECSLVLQPQISPQNSPVTKEGLQKIVDFSFFIPFETRDLKIQFYNSFKSENLSFSIKDYAIPPVCNERYIVFRSLLI